MVMPRYQRAGVQLSSMPAVSTIGLQEAARTSQVLSQSMDRISNFAFRQAETQAQIKGREYGAVNAPTPEQLQDAISSGQDVSAMIPGDQTTVFGSAARATALDAVTAQFEMGARQSIVELQAAFEDERIGLNDMRSSLEDLVATQTDIVRRISPEAATKFSASMGIISNSAFLEAAKKQATRDRADIEIMVRADIDAIMMNAETIVRAGEVEGLSVDQRLDLVRQQLASDAQLLNDPNLYQVKIKELNQRISEAKINVVLDSSMTNPGRALMALSGQGKFEDEDTQDVFNSMTTPERLDLQSKLQSALSNKFTLESRQEDANEKARGKVLDTKEIELFDARTRGLEEDVDRILEEIKELDESAYLSLAAAVYTEGGIDNADVIADLENLILSNDLTKKDIDAAKSNSQISSSTHTSFRQKLETVRGRREKAAMEYVKRELGYPPKGIYNLSDPDREAIRKINRIEQQLEDAKEINPDMDMDAFVRERVREIQDQGPTETQIKQAQGRIDALRGQLNLPSNASTAEVKTALNKAVGEGKFNAQGASSYDGDFRVLENQ